MLVENVLETFFFETLLSLLAHDLPAHSRIQNMFQIMYFCRVGRSFSQSLTSLRETCHIFGVIYCAQVGELCTVIREQRVCSRVLRTKHISVKLLRPSEM